MILCLSQFLYLGRVYGRGEGSGGGGSFLPTQLCTVWYSFQGTLAYVMSCNSRSQRMKQHSVPFSDEVIGSGGQ